MISKSGSLTPENTLQFTQFLKADPSFEFLYQYLIGSKKVLAKKREIKEFLPSFEKLSWHPDVLALYPDWNGNVTADSIAHEAVHLLLAEHLKANQPGMPKMSLLAESIASATNYYFFLARAALGDLQSESLYLKMLERSAFVLKTSFHKHVVEGIQNPFEAFKKYVHGTFRISQLVLDHELRTRKTPPARHDHKRLLTQIKKDPQIVLYRELDFGVFVLHVLANRPFPRSPADDRAVKTVLDLLKTSNSFAHFVARVRKVRAPARRRSH